MSYHARQLLARWLGLLLRGGYASVAQRPLAGVCQLRPRRTLLTSVPQPRLNRPCLPPTSTNPSIVLVVLLPQTTSTRLPWSVRPEQEGEMCHGDAKRWAST